MSTLKTWIAQLSKREKILISILAILLAAVFVWYAVVQPLRAGLLDAKLEYKEMLERHASVKSKVQLLSSNQQKKIERKTQTESLSAYIKRDALERGFTLSNDQAENNDHVSIAIDSARSTALFGWISELESVDIRTETLSTRPAAPGTISATVSFSRK